MKRDYNILKKHFGSHVAVARELGISSEHYRRVRNHPDKFPGSKMLREFVAMKATAIRVLEATGK